MAAVISVADLLTKFRILILEFSDATNTDTYVADALVEELLACAVDQHDRRVWSNGSYSHAMIYYAAHELKMLIMARDAGIAAAAALAASGSTSVSSVSSVKTGDLAVSYSSTSTSTTATPAASVDTTDEDFDATFYGTMYKRLRGRLAARVGWVTRANVPRSTQYPYTYAALTET